MLPVAKLHSSSLAIHLNLVKGLKGITLFQPQCYSGGVCCFFYPLIIISITGEASLHDLKQITCTM